MSTKKATEDCTLVNPAMFEHTDQKSVHLKNNWVYSCLLSYLLTGKTG